MGFLTENHKCPGGVWARVSKALATVLIGGAIGTMLVYALDERPVSALVLAGAALGAVLANAIRQAVGGRP
jgi:Zn-dependent protease